MPIINQNMLELKSKECQENKRHFQFVNFVEHSASAATTTWRVRMLSGLSSQSINIHQGEAVFKSYLFCFFSIKFYGDKFEFKYITC